MSSHHIDDQKQHASDHPSLDAAPDAHEDPPFGYYPMIKDDKVAPPPPAKTKSRGDGFWRGCCAGLCCYCCLDMCF